MIAKGISLILAATFLITASAQAQEGELPGDGGEGGARCWNCEDYIGQNGVTYKGCKLGALVGSSGCMSGGQGDVSVCNVSGTCGGSDDELLASGYVSRNGLSTNSARLSLSLLEQRGVLLYSELEAVAARRNCKGHVSSLNVSGLRVASLRESALDQ
jgi:hypothetical protein